MFNSLFVKQHTGVFACLDGFLSRCVHRVHEKLNIKSDNGFAIAICTDERNACIVWNFVEGVFSDGFFSWIFNVLDFHPVFNTIPGHRSRYI